MTDPAGLTATEAAEAVLEGLERRIRVAVALVLEGTPELTGSRIVALGTAPQISFVGEVSAAPVQKALEELTVRGLAGEAPQGSHELPTPEASRVYLELHRPQPELVILGAGHIARPLATLGSMLGLHVTVLDDRPDFATTERFPDAAHVRTVDFERPFHGVPVHGGTHVVLVTRGHRYDYEALKHLLAEPTEPAYIGMIGSRRRVRATFHQVLEEGFDVERLERVRAPVGLDLRSETPAEIAIAIAAEIVMVQRGGTGAPLSDEVRVLDRFFHEKEGR